ncbi:MAG: thioredoxin domain-containing protein, partial [Chloroflexota bacterium]|nr:thioredoxin domain-containing protein [Chloroflexota bacterium]
AFGEALNALVGVVLGVSEVAIVGAPSDAATRALLDLVQKPYRPDVITALAPASVAAVHESIPLLDYRVTRGAAPTAYVCQRFVCQMPVTAPDALAGLLPASITIA